ncbi:hypothetical protein AG1IA_03036 [Rhizoctonia solani AG-1 IA]|uniref:Uncharacterized protein n=1 Tax=Thanatephorus cucumeris (strain AG1-IA) TaxID=983506 RepID=L8WY53_THACA|nr:hypothetical protein AG1IA_03036 [Rhizoctonia solani AG-1 IA]
MPAAGADSFRMAKASVRIAVGTGLWSALELERGGAEAVGFSRERGSDMGRW